jgi:Flp pilus assembly protein TadD
LDRKDNADELKTLEFLQGVAERLPEDVTVLKAVGDLYTRAGLYERGLETDRRLSCLQPSDPGVWYNLGCSLALVRRRAEALQALDRAVQLGYADHRWMEEDDDLRSLRADEEFKALVQRIKRRPAGAEDASR